MTQETRLGITITADGTAAIKTINAVKKSLATLSDKAVTMTATDQATAKIQHVKGLLASMVDAHTRLTIDNSAAVAAIKQVKREISNITGTSAVININTSGAITQVKKLRAEMALIRSHAAVITVTVNATGLSAVRAQMEALRSRTISILVDNRAALKAIREVKKALESLTSPTVVKINTGPAAHSLKALADQIKQIQTQLGSLNTRGLTNVGNASRQAASGFAGLAAASIGVAGLVTQLRSLVSVSAQIDSLKTSFNMVEGSVAGANSQLMFAKRTAEQLGMSYSLTAKSFLSFAAATKGTAMEGEQARDIFYSMSSALSRLGKDNYSIAGSLKAVEQMISKGNVQAEELRGQLGEHLPGAFGLAAKAMGKTTEELTKMMANGEVTAEELLPKLAKELKALYDNGLPVGTLQAEWNRFTNRLDEARVAANNLYGVNEMLMASLRNMSSALKDDFVLKVANALDSYARIRADIKQSADIIIKGTGGDPGASAYVLNQEFTRLGELLLELPDSYRKLTVVIAGETDVLILRASAGWRMLGSGIAAVWTTVKAKVGGVINDMQKMWFDSIAAITAKLAAFAALVGNTAWQSSLDATSQQAQQDSALQETQTAALWQAEAEAAKALVADQRGLILSTEELAGARRDATLASLDQIDADKKASIAARGRSYEIARYQGDLMNTMGIVSESAKNNMMSILPVVDEAAKRFGVAQSLILALMKQESEFNKNARNPDSGAKGLMQIIPSTAKDIARALNVPVEKVLNDWQTNIMGGVLYLRKQLKDFNGDTEKALRAYNAGPGNVQNGKAYGFAETNKYVKEIIPRAAKYHAIILQADMGTKGLDETTAKLGLTYAQLQEKTTTYHTELKKLRDEAFAAGMTQAEFGKRLDDVNKKFGATGAIDANAESIMKLSKEHKTAAFYQQQYVEKSKEAAKLYSSSAMGLDEYRQRQAEIYDEMDRGINSQTKSEKAQERYTNSIETTSSIAAEYVRIMAYLRSEYDAGRMTLDEYLYRAKELSKQYQDDTQYNKEQIKLTQEASEEIKNLAKEYETTYGKQLQFSKGLGEIDALPAAVVPSSPPMPKNSAPNVIMISFTANSINLLLTLSTKSPNSISPSLNPCMMVSRKLSIIVMVISPTALLAVCNSAM